MHTFSDEFTLKEHISKPAGEIVWRNGDTVPTGYEVTGSYNIVIKNAQVDKAGHYSCELHKARLSRSVNVIILGRSCVFIVLTIKLQYIFNAHLV